MVNKLSVDTNRGRIRKLTLAIDEYSNDPDLAYSLVDLGTDEQAFIAPDGSYSTREYKISIQKDESGKIELDPNAFEELCDLGSYFKLRLFSGGELKVEWEAAWPDRAGDGVFEIELKRPKNLRELDTEQELEQKKKQEQELEQKKKLEQELEQKKKQELEQKKKQELEQEQGTRHKKPRGYQFIFAVMAVLVVVAFMVIYQNKDNFQSANLDCLEPEVVLQAANNDDLKVEFRSQCITELAQLDEQDYRDLLVSWVSAESEILEVIGDFYNPYISGDLLDGLESDVGGMASSTAATYYAEAAETGLESAAIKLRSLCEQVDPTELFFMYEQCEQVQ